jgi:hypothetical protein
MRCSIYVLALAAALTTAAALAQQPPQMAPGQSQSPHMGPGQQMYGPMMGQGMMMGRGPTMGMMDPTRHIEGRLAFLKTELKITDAQMPQWNAFADAMRANAKRMGDLMNTMMSGMTMGSGSGSMGRGMMMGPNRMSGGAGMSVPERFALAEQHLTAHLEMLGAMKGAATQLYAALSDDQKGIADILIHSPMGMM